MISDGSGIPPSQRKKRMKLWLLESDPFFILYNVLGSLGGLGVSIHKRYGALE